MKYPNGKKSFQKQSNNQKYSNRGMSLENDINQTNDYYRSVDQAIIHKKPTPIQIVKVHYPKRSAAMITEAYFKQSSTTDYNGIYNGKYIDFEAKETKNKTSFPLANFHQHQILHLESVKEHGAICFVLIRFQLYNETYLIKIEDIIDAWYHSKRKSISYKEIQEKGYIVPFRYPKMVDYLSIVKQLYL